METTQLTKSQQKLIDRTTELLASGIDEKDLSIYLDLLETKRAHIAEMDLLLSHGHPMTAPEIMPDFIRQFNNHLTVLHKEQPIIAKDLGYRFNMILETLLLEPSVREEAKATMKIARDGGM